MNGNWAKACAPSTKTSMPRSRPNRTISRTGRICPVRLVMCVTSMTRVRGVKALRNRSTISAAEIGGTGNEIGFTTIPSRRARCSHEVIIRG